jgi:RNA polymerase sigma factor (sigma-70 family)
MHPWRLFVKAPSSQERFAGLSVGLVMPPHVITTASDVAAFTDEELLRLVGEEHCVPARSALVERHYPEVCDLVTRCGKNHSLASADQEDARQEVLCALLKALDEFAAAANAARSAREFRDFLEAFVRGRFANCVRALRRYESHFDRSTPIEELLEQAPWATTGAADPAELAAKRELCARLDAALPDLDASMRRLWDELESGHSFRGSAAALGLSYFRVRRLCQRMFVQVRDRLTDGTDETRGVSETETTRL